MLQVKERKTLVLCINHYTFLKKINWCKNIQIMSFKKYIQSNIYKNYTDLVILLETLKT